MLCCLPEHVCWKRTIARFFANLVTVKPMVNLTWTDGINATQFSVRWYVKVRFIDLIWSWCGLFVLKYEDTREFLRKCAVRARIVAALIVLPDRRMHMASTHSFNAYQTLKAARNVNFLLAINRPKNSCHVYRVVCNFNLKHWTRSVLGIICKTVLMRERSTLISPAMANSQRGEWSVAWCVDFWRITAIVICNGTFWILCDGYVGWFNQDAGVGFIGSWLPLKNAAQVLVLMRTTCADYNLISLRFVAVYLDHLWANRVAIRAKVAGGRSGWSVLEIWLDSNYLLPM